MQKICAFLSLLIAKEIPIARHVGNAGGTAIVTRSSPLRIVSLRLMKPSLSPSICEGSEKKNPITERTAITAMNLSEST